MTGEVYEVLPAASGDGHGALHPRARPLVVNGSPFLGACMPPSPPLVGVGLGGSGSMEKMDGSPHKALLVLKDTEEEGRAAEVGARRGSAGSLPPSFQEINWLMCAVMFLGTGAYWFAVPGRAGVFASLIGIKNEPLGKLLTMVLLVPVMYLYNLLVSYTFKRKHTLATPVFFLFGVLFLLVGLGLAAPSLAPLFETPDHDNTPLFGQVLAWSVYVLLDMYTSLTLCATWSVVASLNMQPAPAAVWIPTLTLIQQVGAVSGATFYKLLPGMGFALRFILFACCCFLTVALLLRISTILDQPAFYHEHRAILRQDCTDDDATLGFKKKGKAGAVGLLDGLTIIVSSRFVAGLLVISTFGHAIGSFVTFFKKIWASAAYPDPLAYSNFIATHAQVANAASLLFAMFGTKFLFRCAGMKWSLIVPPVTFGLFIVAMWIHPNLWVAFTGTIIIKTFQHSLTGPTKELLYVESAPAVKLRARGWIDVFGVRGAKALTSIFITATASSALGLDYCMAMCFVLVVVWLLSAQYLGDAYDHLTSKVQEER